MTVSSKQLWFTAPLQAEIQQHVLPPLAASQVTVAVTMSAVSAGTELLVFRGLVPESMKLDASLGSFGATAGFPLRYGYASVGRVVACGRDVDPQWMGRRVFAFEPHASHFNAAVADLKEIPASVTDEAALFVPNMETAVNLVQDGLPQLGEQVVVAGAGIVGVLLLQLLQQFPLAGVHVIEPDADRRARALRLGAASATDPADLRGISALKQQLGERGADVLFEVSGNPAALDTLVSLSGFCSRVVVGSWYGNKPTTIALGGDAHRNRLQLITSQVSTIAPALCGRWSKSRRFDLVWELLGKLQPQQWIDARVPFQQAPTFFHRLCEPGSVLQGIFIYPT